MRALRLVITPARPTRTEADREASRLARAAASAKREAHTAAIRAAAARPDHASPAMAAVYDALARNGRISAAQTVKDRAREFLRHRMHLDVVQTGLSEMEPADGLAACAKIMRRECGLSRPVGGFTIPANVRAAMLFFRLMRRVERRAAVEREAA